MLVNVAQDAVDHAGLVDEGDDLENDKYTKRQHHIVQQPTHESFCQLEIHKALDIAFPCQVNRFDAEDSRQEKAEHDQNSGKNQFAQIANPFFASPWTQRLENGEIVQMGGPDKIGCRDSE